MSCLVQCGVPESGISREREMARNMHSMASTCASNESEIILSTVKIHFRQVTYSSQVPHSP